MKLTDVKCRNAKPRLKQYKLSDGHGMYLLVKENGSRYWRLKYRLGGKEKVHALGVYPKVTLSEARERRDAALKLIDKGINPTTEKRKQKQEVVAAGEQTFEKVAREWHKAPRDKPWSPIQAKKIMTSLERDIFPFFGKRPIADLTFMQRMVGTPDDERNCGCAGA